MSVTGLVADAAPDMAPAAKPKSERCETCRFWNGLNSTHGFCRRRPPTIAGTFNLINGEADEMGSLEIAGATWFPVTHEEEWCGEFKWLSHLEPVTCC